MVTERASQSESGFEMPARIDSAAIVRPMFGQSVSGDDAFVIEVKPGFLAVIIDVLGHGEQANALAASIHGYVVDHASSSPSDLLLQVHRHCRGSRGAAVGFCFIDASSGSLRFAGVGNITFRRFGSLESRLVSRDGVVGGTMRTPVDEKLQVSNGDVVVLHTDGVASHFEAAAYPRILLDPPRLVAATILHRFGKSHDDASCLVLRYEQ